MKWRVFVTTQLDNIFMDLTRTCRQRAVAEFALMSEEKRKEHLDDGEGWIVQRTLQLDNQIRESVGKFIGIAGITQLEFDTNGDAKINPLIGRTTNSTDEVQCPECDGNKVVITNPHMMIESPCPHCQGVPESRDDGRICKICGWPESLHQNDLEESDYGYCPNPEY